MTDRRCQTAFKEWSVIVQALLRGQQTILLRKGGISEEEGRFSIQSEEFFLYPTKVHQAPEAMLEADSRDLLGAAADQIAGDHVLLKVFAEVTDYQRITDLGRVTPMRPYHVWSDNTVKQRFAYGGEAWLDLFVIRAYRLEKPMRCPTNPSYAGCKSWVQLQEPLPVTGAKPVLTEEAFARQRREILSLLPSSARQV